MCVYHVSAPIADRIRSFQVNPDLVLNLIAILQSRRISRAFTSLLNLSRLSLHTTMAPIQHLSRRAQVTVNGWAGILIIVLLVAAALFCIVVTLLICKRKRARRQRERKMMEEQSRPFVAQQYTPEHSTYEHRVPESQTRGVELESNGPTELHGGMGADVGATDASNGPHQIDGFAAPATGMHDVSPIEMPAHASMR
jgi:hypothetical protein